MDERLSAAKAILKPSTWASYSSAAEKYLKPKFGEWEVREITRLGVKRFVDGLVQTDLEQEVHQKRAHPTAQTFRGCD